MVGVGTCRCQWVIENTGRFLKLNPMLSEVVRSLGSVPLNIHATTRLLAVLRRLTYLQDHRANGVTG